MLSNFNNPGPQSCVHTNDQHVNINKFTNVYHNIKFQIATTLLRGPSINVNIFMSAQTNTYLGGVCENQHFFHILLSFWPDFYFFHGDFCHSKNVDVYSYFFFFWGGGGVSESVWFVHSWKCWHLWMVHNQY